MLRPLPNVQFEYPRAAIVRFVVIFFLINVFLCAATEPSAQAVTRTEKTFGHWNVVCVEPDNEPKRCSMVETEVQINKQTNRKRLVLAWSISINKNHEQTQALSVPAGVSIKEGVRLFVGDTEQPIIVGYSFCGPRLCIADTPLDAKVLAALKASKKASASYVLGSKKLVQVRLDLNGFVEAHEFMLQQL